jgi:hypothetical protein
MSLKAIVGRVPKEFLIQNSGATTIFRFGVLSILACAIYRCRLPSSLLEPGSGWGWVWLKLETRAPHAEALKRADMGIYVGLVRSSLHKALTRDRKFHSQPKIANQRKAWQRAVKLANAAFFGLSLLPAGYSSLPLMHCFGYMGCRRSAPGLLRWEKWKGKERLRLRRLRR